MPIPVEVIHVRTFSGTKRRIYQLLVEMGTAGDAIWPYASQPFMRSPGPLTPGRTEEWHSGLHAVLDEVVPEDRIVWRIDNEGVDGTHGFYIEQEQRGTKLTHKMIATLSDSDGRMLWRRLEDVHNRTMEALFDKIGRVLKR
jgi:hypothetical protein